MSEIEVISHNFIGGVYCKTMRIPTGHVVVTHKHNYDHMSILSQGVVVVDADGDLTVHTAPAVVEIKAGVNHSIQPVDGFGDAIWQCIHATNETDETKVDEVLIRKQNMIKLPIAISLDSAQQAVNQINENSELWDKHDFRTRLYANSPHVDVHDIILRYRNFDQFDPEKPKEFSDKHESVWYLAAEKLPFIIKIISDIVLALGDVDLGGVLITKIPAKKSVLPHTDEGHWHAEYYNRKILILLQSAEGQSFNFYGESHSAATGEIFEFDNRPVHWVDNHSDVDRISLILAIRNKADEA